MLLALEAYALHFPSNILKAPKDFDQFFTSDNQKRALNLGNSSAVSLVPAILIFFLVWVWEYVWISKIGAFHIQVERHIDCLAFTCLIKVNVKLYSSLENKKDFFSIVTLLIEGIFWINFHWF